jgi:hypothetical protein
LRRRHSFRSPCAEHAARGGIAHRVVAPNPTGRRPARPRLTSLSIRWRGRAFCGTRRPMSMLHRLVQPFMLRGCPRGRRTIRPPRDPAGGRCLTRHLAAIRSQEHAGMAGIARPGRRSVSTTDRWPARPRRTPPMNGGAVAALYVFCETCKFCKFELNKENQRVISCETYL